jgi:hypothetical protein
LCYFKDIATASGNGATIPLGVIDLRRILRAAAPGVELVLSSRTREIRFRAKPSGNQSVALEEWLRCITSVLGSEVNADAAPSSTDAEIILSDIYDDGAPRAAQAGNPLHSAVNVAQGSTSMDYSTSSEMPARLRTICVFCGLLRGGPSRASCAYLWSARVWVVFLFVVAAFNMVSPKCVFFHFAVACAHFITNLS